MPKILVVDDEKSHEDLITQRFTQKEFMRNHEFIFALNGLKALELINSHPDIEIALLDINMPGMDGLTLLEKIRDTKPLLRVIMLSAYSDMNNIRAAMNMGAYDFITKPIDMKDLELTIKRTMEEVKQLKETLRIQDEQHILK
jgi:DNA-binding NtrC family response regulator